MKFWTKTVLAILPALMLLGCGTSGEVQDDAAGAGASTSKTTDSGSSADTSGASTGGAATGEAMDAKTEAGFQGDPLDDPNSLLAKRVVYFDYDKSEIKSDYRSTIQAHAEYLVGNPSVSLSLEGHGDERGTREYNIALGESRAQAVQRLLTLQGVSSSQIRTISYGEERPAALGHDDDAWSLNRRAELVYGK